VRLDLRPFPFAYIKLGLSRGQIDPSGMAQYLGDDTPETLTPNFDEMTLGVGLRLPISNRIDLSAGVSMRAQQDLVIQYPETSANVNRIFSIKLPASMSFDATMSVRLFNNMELFYEYSYSHFQTSIEAKDLSAQYDPAIKISSTQIGVSFTAP